ncbi:MAG TPA: type II secretion system protein [Verrucomicrobiae bacterium]|nr:type II secretion system protein [Verrucomicrobiae bacterium]
MKVRDPILNRRTHRAGGFSLVEVTVGMAVVGTSAIALFSGFTSGFFTMQMARENLRATQIMLEKTETIRLYSWDQINTAGFIPTAFTAPYDPNSTNSGITYQGRMTITPCPLSTTFSNDMRAITVTLNWTTGSLNRSRSFTTYIARNGLQNYIY